MDPDVFCDLLDRFEAHLDFTVGTSIMMGVRIADYVNGTKTDYEKVREALAAISKGKLTVIPSEAEIRMKLPNARNVRSVLDYNKSLEHALAIIFVVKQAKSISVVQKTSLILQKNAWFGSIKG